MRKIFYVSVIATLLIVSCKKQTIDELYEDKTGKGPRQVLPVISNSFWRLTAIQVTYANGTIYDSIIDECKRDDVTIYEKNGDMTILHGSALCGGNPSPENGKFGTWQLLDNATRIRETYSREIRGIPAMTIRDFHIDRVKFKELVISRPVNDPNGDYTETTTLTR